MKNYQQQLPKICRNLLSYFLFKFSLRSFTGQAVSHRRNWKHILLWKINNQHTYSAPEMQNFIAGINFHIKCLYRFQFG